MQNGNKSVVLVTHSMGSLMASYFLNQHSTDWREKHIRSLVSSLLRCTALYLRCR